MSLLECSDKERKANMCFSRIPVYSFVAISASSYLGCEPAFAGFTSLLCGWRDWFLVFEKLKLVAVCSCSGLIEVVLKLSPTPLIVVSRRQQAEG